MKSGKRARSVLILGTFGLRPKATLRSRALALARTLSPRIGFRLVTTPWDNPPDAGRRWNESGIDIVNTRAVRPALFPLAVREMTVEFERSQPDIVHLFKPKGFGDLAARRLRSRVPLVVDMDDWEGNGGWNEIGGYSRLQRAVFDWQERTWPRMADAVTVASRVLEQRALSLGADNEAVFYVPNGLTRAHFDDLTAPGAGGEAERRRRSIDSDKVVMLYTRFVEFDPRLLVELIATVKRDVPSATLVVAGASADGRPEHVLRTEARAAGIEDAVRLLGWVEPAELPSILAMADVAIHPFEDTIVNRAKCSVKLLELMAAGLPVVTNRVGENAQMIEHEQSGMLVPAGDVPAISAEVASLLQHPDRARAIGSTAKKRVESEFLWEILAPRVEAAYQAALDRRAARSE